MIRSFADSRTQRLFARQRVPRLSQALERSALRKLLILNAAETLMDLRVPPGNRPGKLRGDRQGQHSIRENYQWRICFLWSERGPEDVELVDYH
jgi:proteic killer suppression protein